MWWDAGGFEATHHDPCQSSKDFCELPEFAKIGNRAAPLEDIFLSRDVGGFPSSRDTGGKYTERGCGWS